jgi:hypothetical protein
MTNVHLGGVRGPGSRRWSDNPAFARLEEGYAAYLEAWGAWMVVHHRGAPLEMGGEEEPAVSDRLIDAREALGRLLADLDEGALGPDDAGALANIRASLPELDAWPDPLLGRTFADLAPGAGIAGPASASVPPEDPETAVLRRETFDAWGAAMADLDIGGERIDRLTLLTRLGHEADPAVRRRLFLAMEPGWRAAAGVDGAVIDDNPYRRLLQSSAERWRRYGSPVDLNAAALGLDPGTVQAALRRVLATYRQLVLGDRVVEPWDYRYELGALDRRLDPLVPLNRLRDINDRHLASLGADPAGLRIHYDIEPRPGRPVIPTAFTTGLEIPRRGVASWEPPSAWIFATYAEGGLGNLEELLHESGHGLHVAATRARPAFVSWPAEQGAFVEAIADVVGWTTHEPAFIEEHLGAAVSTRDCVIARYRTFATDAWWTLFEMELHRHPDRDPNEVWAEIAERDMGVRGHPEWAWWSHRGQLIDGPGYLANYPLGAFMVAAVRARIREVRGEWATGDPGWYAFVADGLLRFGGSRTPRAILDDFLGGPLTADALIADLERAG